MSLKKITTPASIVLISMLMTISCDQGVDISKPADSDATDTRITNYTFDGSEGDPITLQTALSWYANYKDKSQVAIKAHFFGANVLKKILATTNVMGIRIYYSIDDDGNDQLLVLGADNHGHDQVPRAGAKGIRSTLDFSGGSVVDSFTGAEETWMSEEVSMRWMANYTTQYPNKTIAHFFGFQIINQILNQTDCIGMRMYYALNDSGVQQILLVGVNTKGENILPLLQNGGRVEDDPPIGDASYPCPTHCN